MLLETSVFFTLCTHRMKVNFNQIFVHVNFDHAFTGLTSSGRIGQLLFRGGVLWTANDGSIILICIYRQCCSNTVKYSCVIPACHTLTCHAYIAFQPDYTTRYRDKEGFYKLVNKSFEHSGSCFKIYLMCLNRMQGDMTMTDCR